MPRQLLVWVLIGAVGSGALLAANSWYRKHSAQANSTTPATVYVCRKSGDLFVMRGSSASQIHPETGLASLAPGIYCPRCDNWKPSPSVERIYGRPELLQCPKCRTPRTFGGVIPEGTIEL